MVEVMLINPPLSHKGNGVTNLVWFSLWGHVSLETGVTVKPPWWEPSKTDLTGTEMLPTFSCYSPQPSGASLVAQLVKNPPAMRESWVRSLGWEDPLEKGKATQASILAWRIPWTVQSMDSQRKDLTEWLSLNLWPVERGHIATQHCTHISAANWQRYVKLPMGNIKYCIIKKKLTHSECSTHTKYYFSLNSSS